MQLYYDPITVNCRKVLAGLDFVGAKYESVTMDYFGGDHKKAEYVAINPNASIPALVDGDFTLWESNAILQYAADKVGAAQAYPTDAQTRADINRWHLWEASQWFPTCYVYLVENVVKPILGETPDAAVLSAEQARFDQCAGILNDRLGHNDYIVGSNPTIADIAMAAPMHLHSYQKLPLGAYPNIQAWMARVESIPAWAKTDVAPLVGLS
ncbi:MAG: glutathione S-transferase family protein [Gammaproteobacteria bacterium]|nr:glutathione S-transferase family protein [Gammaproteobacteria bacterium]